MKLVDLNILLYVINEHAPPHERVRSWWESALANDEAIGLSWTVLLGFLRLSTNDRIFPSPLRVEEATAQVEDWLSHPIIHIVRETKEHWHQLKGLLAETGTAGNLTTDAHLAALAISYGATLVSCDTDFARFPHLRWENPLSK